VGSTARDTPTGDEHEPQTTAPSRNMATDVHEHEGARLKEGMVYLSSSDAKKGRGLFLVNPPLMTRITIRDRPPGGKAHAFGARNRPAIGQLVGFSDLHEKCSMTSGFRFSKVIEQAR
jgi:hypothetical protein